MEQECLTIPEVAKLLKLGERTVYQLARDGRLVGAAKKNGKPTRRKKRAKKTSRKKAKA